MLSKKVIQLYLVAYLYVIFAPHTHFEVSKMTCINNY